MDFSQYIRGFFSPGSDGLFHNIIERQEKGHKLYTEQQYDVVDINRDGELDFVLVDGKKVFIKYGNQNDSYGGGGFGGYWLGPTLGSVEMLQSLTEETDGYVTVNGDAFKLWDDLRASTTYERFGHSFDAISFVWEQDAVVDAYVIAVTERVDVQFDKYSVLGNSDTNEVKYILVVPTDIDRAQMQLELPHELDRDDIQSYIDDETIIEVQQYDAKVDNIDTILYNLQEKWRYTKVAPLTILEQSSTEGILWFTQTVQDIYFHKAGPWSTQSVGGTQAWGDDQPPVVTPTLIRDITGEEVDQGESMIGFVNTQYTLDIDRQDNGEVIKNWIVYSGEIIFLEEDADAELLELKYAEPTEEYFTLVAMDQAGNVATQEIQLLINVPALDIARIEYDTLGADIVA